MARNLRRTRPGTGCERLFRPGAATRQDWPAPGGVSGALQRAGRPAARLSAGDACKDDVRCPPLCSRNAAVVRCPLPAAHRATAARRRHRAAGRDESDSRYHYLRLARGEGGLRAFAGAFVGPARPASCLARSRLVFRQAAPRRRPARSLPKRLAMRRMRRFGPSRRLMRACKSASIVWPLPAALGGMTNQLFQKRIAFRAIDDPATSSACRAGLRPDDEPLTGTATEGRSGITCACADHSLGSAQGLGRARAKMASAGLLSASAADLPAG